MKKLFNSMLVLVAVLALVACGGETSPTTAPATDSNTTAPATGGAALTIDSADGANMAYAQTTQEATAGAVSITFNNKGAMPHNLTITKEADAETANNAATSAAPDYLAPGALAQTKLLNGGESETVTANLEAGTYTYFCTFPGHFASGMKGTLVVK